MAKFSGNQVLARPKGVVRTTDSNTTTYEGGSGWNRDAKSELFLLAISNMVLEDTFYESGKERDNRFRDLVHQVARTDPEWVARFIPYLRNTMQMRSASVVMAAEYVKALEGVDRRSLNQRSLPRHVVTTSMSRADEPAELIGYWLQTYGRRLPMPIKRGISDATHRLYTQKSALKYDGISRDIRMADVIELVHAKPQDQEQSRLFRYLLERRHNRDELTISDLSVIEAAHRLQTMPVAERRAWLESDEFDPELLELAGFTWERLSGWLQGPMDKQAWEAIIPSMGYMALIRNLRNFEQAGISQKTQDYVIQKIQDPEVVRKSRQFPIRFYSAFKASDSLTYASALERALSLSLQNVPFLKGTTLILIDTSSSMSASLSAKSKVQGYEIASLFGLAVAHRTEKADVYTYNNNPTPLHVGNSLLLDMKNVADRCYGGTDTFGSLDKTYKGQDRVIILTDEQAHPAYFGGTSTHNYGYYNASPETILNHIKVPIYTFNVAGYKSAQMENGVNGRYAFGGLTDAGFRMIDLLEKYQEEDWPWMKD